MYQMYNPSLLKIEVLKLERSVDEELYYLRYKEARGSMGVARRKSGWGSFPNGRRPRAGCRAEFFGF